jgi:hypothetical protein
MASIIAKPKDRIRAYDYNPKKTGSPEVYLEGEVLDIVHSPYLAYKVRCDKSTFTNLDREGKVLNVPVALASHDFDGRIINLSDN